MTHMGWAPGVCAFWQLHRQVVLALLACRAATAV